MREVRSKFNPRPGRKLNPGPSGWQSAEILPTVPTSCSRGRTQKVADQHVGFPGYVWTEGKSVADLKISGYVWTGPRCFCENTEYYSFQVETVDSQSFF